jgi:hypothetical protein
MSRETNLLAIVLVLLVFNISFAIISEKSRTHEFTATSAVLRSIGFTGLAISSECTATRNPILETICACLGDLPGSYCYHESCSIVGVSVPAQAGNQTDQIKVLR